jgi:hypothetical protein
MIAHRLGAIIITALMFAPALQVAADDPPPAKDAAALVQQLGSKSFPAREAAEKQLRELGLAALPAIKAGMMNPDAEIAQRCKLLLPAIRFADSEAFLAGKKEHDSPAWRSFKTLVGDSKESRQIFAEMMADDRRADAIERAEANPAKAHEVYAAEMDRAKQLLDQAMRPFMGQPISDYMSRSAQKALREAFPAPEVATVLFIGRTGLPVGVKDATLPHWIISTGFADGVGGPMGPQFRKLYAAWLDHRRDSAAIRAGINASLIFALKEGVPTARRLATDKATDPKLIAQALLVIGHHGARDDLALLREFRKDERKTTTIMPVQGGQVDTNPLSDIAAAMSLQLSGQDFEKFGFGSDTLLHWYIRDGAAPYRGVSGFDKEADREAALKKAWAWLDAQPKVEAVPPAP